MKLFIIFFLISFASCLPLKKMEMIGASEAEIKIYNEWLYSFKILNFNQNAQLITRPPGVSQLIFRLTIPEEGGVALKTHCVYYRVPYKEIEGLLSIDEIKSDLACPENPSTKPWLEIKKINNLKVTFENFKLYLDFTREQKNIKWTFLLPNISNGLIHEKYQAVKEKKLYSGMSFLRINHESFLNINNKYLGKLSDKMSTGTAIRCHQVDKNCQTIGENRCDDCRYGWYQVADYQCPQGGSKFCGPNHCGEKNEPACPRGIKAVAEEDFGICQNDLSPVMNADHILICQ